jgi:hypothetical protein
MKKNIILKVRCQSKTFKNLYNQIKDSLDYLSLSVKS